MEHELLIMRHGKSAWDTGADSDFDRTLAPRGISDCALVAKRLVNEKLIPDAVLSSSAVRATQTTLRICKAAQIPQSVVCWDPHFYDCGADFWLQEIRKVSDQAGRLMLIGHNPAMTELLELLCVQKVTAPDNGKLMPTAALARLRVLVPWKDVNEDCAALVEVTRPNAAETEID